MSASTTQGGHNKWCVQFALTYTHFYSFIVAPVLLLRLSVFLHCILLSICVLCNCGYELSIAFGIINFTFDDIGLNQSRDSPIEVQRQRQATAPWAVHSKRDHNFILFRRRYVMTPAFEFDFELRFYVSLDTKYIISKTFFSASLSAGTVMKK